MPACPTVGHTGQEVNAGAAATVLAADASQAFLACEGQRCTDVNVDSMAANDPQVKH
jgi:hypothetical protein